MPGVASEMNEVQVEGTFPDGTKLVTIDVPICKEDGDLALALQVCPCVTIYVDPSHVSRRGTFSKHVLGNKKTWNASVRIDPRICLSCRFLSRAVLRASCGVSFPNGGMV